MSRVVRVEFFPGNIQYETFMVFGTLFKSGRGYENITKKWPGFDKLVKTRSFKKNKLKAFQDVKNEVALLYIDNFKDMYSAAKKYQIEWDKVNDKFMSALEKVLGTKWSGDVLVKASVGINPGCPRNIKTYTYTLPFWASMKFAIHASAHEITHFLYFKKLKEMIPDINTKTFQSPHKEWLLSEVLAPILMNDKRISDIIGTSYKGTYAAPKNISVKINKIYQEHVIEKKSFEDFYFAVRNKRLK